MGTKATTTRHRHWLDAAVLATAVAYKARGTAYLEPTDQGRLGSGFVGVVDGVPASINLFLVRGSVLTRSMIRGKSFSALDKFAQAGGLGLLLVCFERLEVAGTYAVTPAWIRKVLAEVPGRRGVPAFRFAQGAGRPSEECQELFHGKHGVPVDFAPSIPEIRRVQVSGG